MVWLEHMVAPILFSICSSIIILLYVTVRPSGLPFFVYIWFPLVAIVAMSIMSWVVYDAVRIKRTAEQVIGTLESRSEPFYRELSLVQRNELSRRARALRPVHLSVGNFADLSPEILANMWDEVLNQLLFLLSL